MGIMKNKLSFLLSVVCLWGVILVSGCSEKDETPTNLTLKEGTLLRWFMPMR